MFQIYLENTGGALTLRCVGPANWDARTISAVHAGALACAPSLSVLLPLTGAMAAEANWHIAEYGNAYHAFTDPEARSPQTGRAYDALADHMSWASTLSLLAATLR
jgi:dienelactone hydrolase